MTLYVDIIFLENIFMNSIILLATGVILKAPIRILRNLIASTIGSIYAIIIYVSNIEIYSNFFLKLVLSFAIIYVAFKPVNIKSFLKYVVIFLFNFFYIWRSGFCTIIFCKSTRYFTSRWCFNRYISYEDNIGRRNSGLYYNNNIV